MKKIELNVQEPYRSFLLTGKKTIEGRLNKGKFSTLSVDDILILDKVNLKVISIKKYDTFKDMLSEEGVDRVIPDKKDITEAEKVYYKFYAKEDERKFGVVAIEVRVLK